MNKLVMEIELKMKLETIRSGFMVGMELDSKNGSLAGQALDMMLNSTNTCPQNYFVSTPTTWRRESWT